MTAPPRRVRAYMSRQYTCLVGNEVSQVMLLPMVSPTHACIHARKREPAGFSMKASRA